MATSLGNHDHDIYDISDTENENIFGYVFSYRNTWTLIMAFIGLIAVIAGMWLLFWNEIRKSKTTQSLIEARAIITSITDTKNNLLWYDGRLVHFSGPLFVDQPLIDTDYGIAIQSVKLKRYVEMYQWIEHKSQHTSTDAYNRTTTTTTYYYTAEWRDSPIWSTSFTHRNPQKFPIDSYTQTASEVKIDDVKLATAMKDKFNKYLVLCSNYYYLGTVNPSNPCVGDVRISFLCAGKSGDNYSVIGKLMKTYEADVIVPYMTKVEREILLLRPGNIDANGMFQMEVSKNNRKTWGFRCLGGFILLAGAGLLTPIVLLIIERLKKHSMKISTTYNNFN